MSNEADRALAAAVERLSEIQRTHAVCPGASGWVVAGECIRALRTLRAELHTTPATWPCPGCDSKHIDAPPGLVCGFCGAQVRS